MAGPQHSRPPFVASCIIVLDAVFVPSPHDALHSEYSDQSPHSQSKAFGPFTIIGPINYEWQRLHYQEVLESKIAYFSLNLSIAFKDMLPKVGPDQVLPALVMATGAKKKVKINVLSISEKI